MTSSGLRAQIEQALGHAVIDVTRLSGGDIGQAYRVTRTGAPPIFIKSYPGSDGELERAEAQALRWLASPSCILTPEVLHVSAPSDQHSFIALEFIQSGPRIAHYDETLGRSLAALHLSGAPRFGFETPGFIGRLPQSNNPHATWSDFYREERLRPQLRRAADAQHLSSGVVSHIEELMTKLDQRAGPPEPPSRLHGDLWAGNQHVGANGQPYLIDPAAYGGHREMDLAMMQLFGGFSARVFAAYAEAAPLAPGHAARVPLYQLYPLLVHVNLFGAGYARAVQQAVIQALRA